VMCSKRKVSMSIEKHVYIYTCYHNMFKAAQDVQRAHKHPMQHTLHEDCDKLAMDDRRE
jgi:hypothetical protein